MSRTQWPLLNRGRLHGTSTRADFSHAAIIDPKIIVPMNVQYAWDTSPLVQGKTMKDVMALLNNSGIRPPFPDMWFEWVTTAYGDYSDRDIDTKKIALISDSCVVMYRPTDSDADVRMLAGWDSIEQRGRAKHYPVPLFVAMEINFDMFTKGELKEDTGFQIGATEIGESLAEQHGSGVEDLCKEGLDCLLPVLWSWLLLSCKNVTTIESQPCLRNNKRQKDPLRIVHRELHVAVPPGGNRRQSVSEGDETAGTAFHLRRGHFADYTKGKGLFGKYHGKYWIPPMTVGDVDYGTVLKSYRLEGVN